MKNNKFNVGDKVYCTVWASRGWYTVTTVRPRDGYIKITGYAPFCPPHNFVLEGEEYSTWLAARA